MSEQSQKLTLVTENKPVLSDEEQAIMSAINGIVNSPENIHLSFREKIEVLEKVMLAKDQVEIPVEHEFVGGMYIRRILIPKGTLLTSKYHKFGQYDIMLTGRMSILTDKGVMQIKAPYYGASTPGLKRFGYAHEDTLWMDMRVAEEDSIDNLEKKLFCNTYAELIEHEIQMFLNLK